MLREKSNQNQSLLSREGWRLTLMITRREVVDSFRDWRIIIPIVILTLGMPLIMTFGARSMLNFVSDYGAEIIANQLIPFLLLVVGFLPMTFSLVIALETFVGEKERKSLEPLLVTPLSNLQLYIGKMIAAVIPPLIASYLGIAVYLIGLKRVMDWSPTWGLFILILILTTVQGIVMVSAAVVISSQTTSVRASNLLASFVIIPMAFLVQVEAVVIFWGRSFDGLWGIVAGLIVLGSMFMRMGVHLFNREELLGRSIDHLRIGHMVALFWDRLTGKEEGQYPSVRKWYSGLKPIMREMRLPLISLMIALLGAVLVGIYLANRFPFPPHWQARLAPDEIANQIPFIQDVAGKLSFDIFLQNVRVVAIAVFLGLLSFGVLGVVVLMLPIAILSFIGAQMFLAGESVWWFTVATILPHGIPEIIGLAIGIAAGLRWHIMLVAPPTGKTVGESWIEAAADATRVFWGIVVPILLISSFIEGYITPIVAGWVYGV